MVVGATMGTCQSSWRFRVREVPDRLNILSSAIISGWIVVASVGTIIDVGDEIGVMSISVKAQGPLRCDLHEVVVTSNDD